MTGFNSKRMMALALAGASMVAISTPAEAQWYGRNAAAAAGIGFVAGALIGGAVVSQQHAYYGAGYYYGSPYQPYGYYGPRYRTYGYYAPRYRNYGYYSAPYRAYGYYGSPYRYDPGLGSDYNLR